MGLGPCWDVTCWGDELEWGCHRQIAGQSARPAGKALNVTRALSWMGQGSTAAGLWGAADYDEAAEQVASWGEQVQVAFTRAVGKTRLNVTLIDQGRGQELHLRAPDGLATRESLGRLADDLGAMVERGDWCVLAGSMPGGELLDEVAAVVRRCRDLGVRLVVDTSGVGLRMLVELGGVWLIKPNVQELGELLGREVADEPGALAAGAREVTDRVATVLVSRGARGAVAVTQRQGWRGMSVGAEHEVFNTVGCGDYLLAGFLQGWQETDCLQGALESGLKAATAKAWGWAEQKNWGQVRDEIELKCESQR